MFAQPAGRAPDRLSENERMRAQMDKLSADVAALKSDPDKAKLEKQKLEQEVAKLRAEVIALSNTAVGYGRMLPWLQGASIGSLIGGVLVFFAGRSLSSVQRAKLQQEIEFAGEDHRIQRRKLEQEVNIARSQHSLKLFEALGSAEARIRIGAASELGQRVRELNDQPASVELSAAEKVAGERERQTIIRVLIAVSKHEEREELQKHMADLIVNLLGACDSTLPKSPLEDYDFQGARLANAWWKGVDARKADFYGASLARAGLGESRLSQAIFKNADLRGATLRRAMADEANFEKADLSNIKAAGANFTKANLAYANLSGAHLEKADFTGAKLDGANFKGAHLEGATLPLGFKADDLVAGERRPLWRQPPAAPC
jgi:hypothetical protein